MFRNTVCSGTQQVMCAAESAEDVVKDATPEPPELEEDQVEDTRNDQASATRREGYGKGSPKKVWELPECIYAFDVEHKKGDVIDLADLHPDYFERRDAPPTDWHTKWHAPKKKKQNKKQQLPKKTEPRGEAEPPHEEEKPKEEAKPKDEPNEGEPTVRRRTRENPKPSRKVALQDDDDAPAPKKRQETKKPARRPQESPTKKPARRPKPKQPQRSSPRAGYAFEDIVFNPADFIVPGIDSLPPPDGGGDDV